MRIRYFLSAALIGMSLCASPAQATHIYLLKGLAGIFSTGLDTLADELKRRGFAATVHAYDDYDTLGPEAAQLARTGKGPIIIIGHSLGADTAFAMAKAMKGAPVALVVLFGPDGNMTVPANVERVLCYVTGDIVLHKAPGFRGSIRKVSTAKDPGINHFNIEKIESLHAKVIAEIAAIAGHHEPSAKPRVAGDKRQAAIDKSKPPVHASQ